MINKGAFSQVEDRDAMSSSCPIALTASSPSSPANDSSRSASSTFNPRTAPNCARCKNHGLKVPLKGHKRYCRYWKCACDKCVQTSTRQKVMAKETAHRRARKLHETKILEYRRAQERARIMGEKSPEPPMELFNPILSPDTKSSSDVDDDRSASPGSLPESGIYQIGLRKSSNTPASIGKRAFILSSVSRPNRPSVSSSDHPSYACLLRIRLDIILSCRSMRRVRIE